MYTYRAKLAKVVDGDTIYATLDLGFYTSLFVKLRLAGINAPEVRGPERPRGLAAKEWMEKTLPQDFIVATGKDTGKYGRWIGTIFIYQDDLPSDLREQAEAEACLTEIGYAPVYNLNELMVELGWAERAVY